MKKYFGRVAASARRRRKERTLRRHKDIRSPGSFSDDASARLAMIAYALSLTRPNP